jgi:hypothetical protein
MKIIDFCEAATEEFRWYENPTHKQIDDVAGENDKVRFVAYPSKKVIVFPYDERPKEFLSAIKQPLEPLNALHGIAQKAGVAWLVIDIVNMKRYMLHLVAETGGFESKDWDWLNKYFNFGYFLKKKELLKPIETETEKGHMKNIANKSHWPIAGMKKTNLKDFIDKHGEN